MHDDLWACSRSVSCLGLCFEVLEGQLNQPCLPVGPSRPSCAPGDRKVLRCCGPR
jgi:hypothetical protein